MKLKDTDKILEELTKIKDKKRKDNAEAFVNNQLDISYWLNAQATQLEDVIRLIEKAPTVEERPTGEINAYLFKQTFGISATELWAMNESQFLEWLNSEYDMKKGEEE